MKRANRGRVALTPVGFLAVTGATDNGQSLAERGRAAVLAQWMAVRDEEGERRWWRGGWPDGKDNAGVDKDGRMDVVAVGGERRHDVIGGGDPNPRQVGAEKDLESLRCWSAEWGEEGRTL
ncbi:hypothetical protein V8G54_025173 [Vigna mungo]|uniref:Uncharacterized protein n=1 Tax=Vigna mungo TaxID=3915 RepID=A0AAQ3RS04_VIGMU